MTQKSSAHSVLPFSTFRMSLAFFFLLYTYITAKTLIPLPDQAPRIDFWGVFCATLGFVAAYYCLTSSYRLFLVGMWAFIPIAIWQTGVKITFLEMMLEPNLPQKMVSYGLYGVLLVLISPVAVETFNQSYRAYNVHKGLLIPKGIQF